MKTLPFVGAANPAQKIYQDLSGMPVTKTDGNKAPSLKITGIGQYREFYEEVYNMNMCELTVSFDNYITGWDDAQVNIFLFEKEFIDNYYPDGIPNDFNFSDWIFDLEQQLGNTPWIMQDSQYSASYGSFKTPIYDWSRDENHFPQANKDYVLVLDSFPFNWDSAVIDQDPPHSVVTMQWRKPVEKTDTLNISENGSYDVKDYKNVNVDVEMPRIAKVLRVDGNCGGYITGAGETFYPEPDNWDRWILIRDGGMDVMLVGTRLDCENWAEQNGFIFGHQSTDDMPEGYDGIAPSGYMAYQLQPCADCTNYGEEGYESEEQCNCDYYNIGCEPIAEV